MAKRKRQRRRWGYIYSRNGRDGVATYYAQWPEPGTGRRVSRAIGENRKDAEAFLDELERRTRLGVYETPKTVAEADRVEPPAPAAPMFTEYARRYLDRRADIRPATRACYEANLGALCAYFGKRVERTGDERRTVPARRLDELTPAAVHDFWRWRQTHSRARYGNARAVSTCTLNRDASFASMVLGAAVADGLIAENPLHGMKKLREPKRAPRFLSKPEVARLLLAASAPLRAMMLGALFTGCRGQELRGLRWGDVSFDAGTLTIYRPKTSRGDVLPLHPVLGEELRQLRAARPAARPDDVVFLSSRGTPYGDVRYAWRKAVKRAGLDGRAGVTFHALRHTFAAHFLEGGAAITDLQAQLGHAKLTTTQRYAAAVDTRRRATVLSLDYGTPADGATRASLSNTLSNTLPDTDAAEGGSRDEPERVAQA